MKNEYNFSIDKGTDFERQVKWKNQDGTYVDFTGYLIKIPIRALTKKGDLFIELSNDNGKIIINKETITIVLNDAETLLFKDYTYYYNLDITKDNITTRLLEGKISINENVPVKDD